MKIAVALAALALTACVTGGGRNGAVTTVPQIRPAVVVYVIKRSWHTDIGIAASDLTVPLSAVHETLPRARYVLFGFGDRHYLIDHGRSARGMIGAVWPGAGLVLVTGLAGTPEEAFGAPAVIRLTLRPDQAAQLEEFVWTTLATTDGIARVLAPGPYEDSVYYASTARYSGLHTCNTWTAEALRAAGLPVRSFAVEFSGQVWRQVRKLDRQDQPRTRQP